MLKQVMPTFHNCLLLDVGLTILKDLQMVRRDHFQVFFGMELQVRENWSAYVNLWGSLDKTCGILSW